MYIKLRRTISKNGFLSKIALSSLKIRAAIQTLTRKRRIQYYIQTHYPAGLQIGCGVNVLDGWLNTDVIPRISNVIPMNAAKPFPFPDNTFDHVFSEHQIQVLSLNCGQFMLNECYRVMKPGGIIRVAALNLERLMALIRDENTDQANEYIKWSTDQFIPDAKEYRSAIVINNAFRAWGTLFVYDISTLESSISGAGFVNITQQIPGQSDTPALREIESHGKAIGNEKMNRFETIVLEGKKPP